MAAASFTFGREVAFGIEAAKGLYVRHGLVITDDGRHLVLCAPFFEGNQSVKIKDTQGAPMEVSIEMVLREHVVPSEEYVDDPTRPAHRFSRPPDLRVAAAAYYGGDAPTSSDAKYRRPARAMTGGAAKRQPAGAEGHGRPVTPFGSLAAAADAWAQEEADNEDGESVSSEDFKDPEGPPGPQDWKAQYMPQMVSGSRTAGRGPSAPLFSQAQDRPRTGIPTVVPSLARKGGGVFGGHPPAWPAAGLAGSPAAGPDVNQMIQLEMLRVLKRMQRGDESSGESGDENKEKDSSTKAFRGVEKSRRKVERHPTKVTAEFVRRMRRELGVVHPTQYWKVADYSRRLAPQFGRLRGLLRCHHAAAEALQEYLQGRPDHMAAMVCLMMQALHQVALDQGSWQNAQLIMVHPDPLSRPEFGADPALMQNISAYRRALTDLQRRQKGKDKDHDDDEPDEAKGSKTSAAKGGGKK